MKRALFGLLLLMLCAPVPAQWKVEVSRGRMDDAVSKVAFVVNERGYKLSVYRGPDGAEWASVAVPDDVSGSLAMFSKRQWPSYRIDRSEVVDLERRRGELEDQILQTEGRVFGWRLPAHGPGSLDEVTKGRRMMLRYRDFLGGDINDVEFGLIDADWAIAYMLEDR